MGAENVKKCARVNDLFKAKWLLYVPPHAQIVRSAHTVYLCALSGSENTAIISLYRIN